MTVHHQADAEQAVNDGVAGAAGDKRRGGERDEARREEAFKGPVV